jgi:hypothetical protein
VKEIMVWAVVKKGRKECRTERTTAGGMLEGMGAL